MYCKNHFWIPAVKRCQKCGKPLCYACIKLFYPIMCESCLLSQNTTIEKNRSRCIDLTITIFIFFTILFLTFDYLGRSFLLSFLFAGIVSCTPLAWGILNQIPIPKTFSSGINYIFYILTKCIISISAGVLIVCLQCLFRIKKYLFLEKE